MADWEDAPGQWEEAKPKRSARAQIQTDRITQDALNPAASMTGVERNLAGAGKFFSDIGKGVAQWTPWGSTRQEIDETQDRDVSLMATPGGFMGNLVGGAAATVPLSMVSGGTLPSVMGVGGALGAAQPVGKDDSRTLNTVLSALTAGGMKVGMDKLGGWLGQRASDKAADLASQKAANTPRDAAIQEAKDLGYKLTPNQAEAGGVAKAVEGLSGSAKMEKLASVKNAKITNNLVREELEDSMSQLGLQGIGRKAMSPQVMADIRTQASPFYKAVDNLQNVAPDQTFAQAALALNLKAPGGAVAHPAEEQIDKLVTGLTKHQGWDGKSLRADITRLRELASSNFSAAKRAGGDVEKTAMAKAQSEAASLLEDLAERNLASNGAPANVISNFRQARQLMAKTYTVENAMDNVGNVSALDLASSKAPMTGGMRKAADFAKNFPSLARDVTGMKDRANFSAFDALLGAGGAMADPTLIGAAMARPGARSVMLSDIGQARMAAPNYNLPMSTRLISDAANNPMLKRTLPLAAVPGMLGVSE